MTEPARARAIVAAALLAAGVSTAGCAPPPRACGSSGDCAPSSSCVAGRCAANGAVAAVSTARRVVLEPVDVGYVGPGEAPGGPPAIATLGGPRRARLLLRFAPSLRPEDRVVEAFVAVERAPGVAGDPVPVVLYAARVVDPWDGRALSWASQPRVQEIGLPETLVRPGAGPRVRLDVRDLVERWRRRGSGDLSVAILAGGEGPTGAAFAVAPGLARGPELELYLR